MFVHPEGGFDLATRNLAPTPDGNLDIDVPTNEAGYLPPPPPETIPEPGAGTTTVTVRGGRAVPVTLFVERGDFDTRIGTVSANREITLELPEWLAMEAGRSPRPSRERPRPAGSSPLPPRRRRGAEGVLSQGRRSPRPKPSG